MKESVFIVSVSSDIGLALAKIYLEHGWRVIGTYRNSENIEEIKKLNDVDLFHCDLMEDSQIKAVASEMELRNLVWDHIIFAAGLLDPIDSFFKCDIHEWKRSVQLNSLQQIHLLHSLYPHKNKSKIGCIAFLVGGAINRAFPSYSAYSLGKVVLVKLCELLANEADDIHPVSIGTGWVRTKIHDQTIAAGDRAGNNLTGTKSFIESGGQGTSVQEIFDCINWCFKHPQAKGRNFSVVHDAWRQGGDSLVKMISDDNDMLLLRRHNIQDIVR